MKRVGIITIQKCGNFGADLQAYALGKKLRRLGYDAENIDYLFWKHPRHEKSELEHSVLPLSYSRRLKEFFFPFVNFIRQLKTRRSIKLARDRNFQKWFSQNVKVGREFRSVKSLYDSCPQYDVYIAGSDQIWNPRLASNIKPYFLDFVSSDAKCISYASSFGTDILQGAVYLAYKRWLKRFSFIGVREKKGREIVESMGLGIDVQQVLDPTLLLSREEWHDVAICPEDVPSKRYLLVYDLIPSKEILRYAKRVADERDLALIRISEGNYGPGEFIWLFEHSSVVITNSFHGTVFSILNRKPFVVVVPHRLENAGRIYSLLQTLRLEHRIVNSKQIDSVKLDWSIDFLDIDQRLDDERQKSISFLVHAIEDLPIRRIALVPKRCYAVWNSDSEIRSESTSGGIFSILAEEILKRGGVVFGSVWSDDFRYAYHRIARDIDELAPMRKSKYVYSDLKGVIQEACTVLALNKWVLFTGTPCQCAMMTKAAKGSARLITVDFVCHGTPEPYVFESYISELEQTYGGKVTRYEFRNKDKGWNFQNVVFEVNGIVHRRLPWLDSFFHGFSINAFLRKCCYSCRFATIERHTDFTIADCWRVAASHPQYDDNKGTSLVLVNTGPAIALWNIVVAKRKLSGGEYDIDLAQVRNSALMHPPVKSSVSDAFFEMLKLTRSFSRASKVYCSPIKKYRYFLQYWIKFYFWFYFRRRQ